MQCTNAMHHAVFFSCFFISLSLSPLKLNGICLLIQVNEFYLETQHIHIPSRETETEKTNAKTKVKFTRALGHLHEMLHENVMKQTLKSMSHRLEKKPKEKAATRIRRKRRRNGLTK